MSFNINYDTELQCLKSEFTGQMSLNLTRDYASELAKNAEKFDCHLLLNDLRGAEIDWSTFELYSLPKLVGGEGLDRQIKRAIICTADQVQSLSFYENVAKDKGWNVKIFTDYDEGLTWLQI